jgi:hypothetical protein
MDRVSLCHIDAVSGIILIPGGSPTDGSLNVTVSGTVPLVGDAVKFAISQTGGMAFTVITFRCTIELFTTEFVAASYFEIV